MKVKLYAVYDVASGVYDGPHAQQTDAVATRNFAQAVNNPESPIGKNPDDFTLFRVGTWDDSNGEIIPESVVKIVNGLEVIANVTDISSAGGTA